MARHEKFNIKSLSQFRQEIVRLGLDLPLSEDVSVLSTPARLGRRALRNRLVVHPMEGCDGQTDGAPAELTLRRYERWSAGGAGLIWVEATAVAPEGRANPRQLWLHQGSAKGFDELLRRSKAAAAAAGCQPVFLLQLTHSGRYSRPTGPRAPIIAHRNPYLDGPCELGSDYPLVSDNELDRLPDAYERAARLAERIGFDGVDIKACHRYLVNEVLAGHERPGRYGGSYENRTRLLRQIVSRVRAACGAMEVACRMNVFDGLPFPYGWGVEKDAPSAGAKEATSDSMDKLALVRPDLTEPLQLIGELAQLGLTCLSVTGGNPYYRPHINRPADGVEENAPSPPEHPLEGVARLTRLTRQVQQAFPALTTVGAGLSWCRQFAPAVAAAAIASAAATLMGLGRGALAYPDFARDLLTTGKLDERKVCIACGGCTQMMRFGGPAGCLVRDKEVYGPIFQAQRAGK